MAVLWIQEDVMRCRLQYKPERRWPLKIFLQQSLRDTARIITEGMLSALIPLPQFCWKGSCLCKQDITRYSQEEIFKNMSEKLQKSIKTMPDMVLAASHVL